MKHHTQIKYLIYFIVKACIGKTNLTNYNSNANEKNSISNDYKHYYSNISNDFLTTRFTSKIKNLKNGNNKNNKSKNVQVNEIILGKKDSIKNKEEGS
jgi:hypothetical protein